MYKSLFKYFIFLNFQFVLNYYSKTYQIKFLESATTDTNINYFLLFSMFNFLLLLCYSSSDYFNKIYLDIPIKNKALVDTNNKIKKMPTLWKEQNCNTKLKELVELSQRQYYEKYNNIFEGYSSIIRVSLNSYIMCNMYENSIYIIFIYCMLYTGFYIYVILNTFDYKKNIGKIISKHHQSNINLYITYFNSCIGNYEDKYIDVIKKNNAVINVNNIKNMFADKLYTDSLGLFQKLLMFLFIYNYLKTNCTVKCSLFLWPLYETLTTLVYQYEYLLHNIKGYFRYNTYTFYDEFNEIYNKELEFENIYGNKVIEINMENYIINHTINYKDRHPLKYNLEMDLKNKKILMQGESGFGKSSICKLIAGYFSDYKTSLSERTLYIPQDVYLNTENRTLYNIITQTDFKINNDENINLFYNIIDNIIPFSDIKNSFKDYFMHNTLDNKTFSGGQEKRIFLAMWIYYILINPKKYDLLIFDEPDKSLDNVMSDNLLNNLLLKRYFKDYNIIIVSHNSINKTYFDEIINFKKDNDIIKKMD